ncbi:MAG: cysteine-rich CWC family protein [Burkholderiales bacterium]|nr:cysteine-rich CWC family protein [Burkholderiales bacterium]
MQAADDLIPLRSKVCPLCGGPNGCAPAESGKFDGPCWCTTVAFSKELLDRVPPAERRNACICRQCAAAGAGNGGKPGA